METNLQAIQPVQTPPKAEQVAAVKSAVTTIKAVYHKDNETREGLKASAMMAGVCTGVSALVIGGSVGIVMAALHTNDMGLMGMLVFTATPAVFVVPFAVGGTIATGVFGVQAYKNSRMPKGAQPGCRTKYEALFDQLVGQQICGLTTADLDKIIRKEKAGHIPGLLTSYRTAL